METRTKRSDEEYNRWCDDVARDRANRLAANARDGFNRFDQGVTWVAAGAVALSVTMLSEISIAWTWPSLLWLSWVANVGAIVASLYSLRSTALGDNLDVECIYTEAEDKEVSEDHKARRDRHEWLAIFLTHASVALCGLGIVLMLIFAFVNLGSEEAWQEARRRAAATAAVDGAAKQQRSVREDEKSSRAAGKDRRTPATSIQTPALPEFGGTPTDQPTREPKVKRKD